MTPMEGLSKVNTPMLPKIPISLPHITKKYFFWGGGGRVTVFFSSRFQNMIHWFLNTNLLSMSPPQVYTFLS